MDRISIIIPAYNIQNYVSSCIDSVAAQTYKNLEVLIVDDGSTDKTPELLDAFAEKDDRFRVIHKENGGVTSARLRGIAEATGEWIGFVDGDDYVEPEMFARLLRNAQEYDAEISHCGYQMVFSNRIDYYYNTGRFAVQSSREALKELLGGSFEPGLVNKLFRKSVIDSVLRENEINSEFRINEDLLMNYYLFRKAHTVVYEDVCLYHYLIRKGSAATSAVNGYKLRDPADVRKTILHEVQGDAELSSLCLTSLTRHWIRVATMRKTDLQKDLAEYVEETGSELRKALGQISRNGRIPTTVKLQAIWAAYWPASYRWIHDLHGEITGAAHKYDLE